MTAILPRFGDLRDPFTPHPLLSPHDTPSMPPPSSALEGAPTHSLPALALPRTRSEQDYLRRQPPQASAKSILFSTLSEESSDDSAPPSPTFGELAGRLKGSASLGNLKDTAEDRARGLHYLLPSAPSSLRSDRTLCLLIRDRGTFSTPNPCGDPKVGKTASKLLLADRLAEAKPSQLPSGFSHHWSTRAALLTGPMSRKWAPQAQALTNAIGTAVLSCALEDHWSTRASSLLTCDHVCSSACSQWHNATAPSKCTISPPVSWLSARDEVELTDAWGRGSEPESSGRRGCRDSIRRTDHRRTANGLPKAGLPGVGLPKENPSRPRVPGPSLCEDCLSSESNISAEPPSCESLGGCGVALEGPGHPIHVWPSEHMPSVQVSPRQMPPVQVLPEQVPSMPGQQSSNGVGPTATPTREGGLGGGEAIPHQGAIQGAALEGHVHAPGGGRVLQDCSTLKSPVSLGDTQRGESADPAPAIAAAAPRLTLEVPLFPDLSAERAHAWSEHPACGAADHPTSDLALFPDVARQGADAWGLSTPGASAPTTPVPAPAPAPAPCRHHVNHAMYKSEDSFCFPANDKACGFPALRAQSVGELTMSEATDGRIVCTAWDGVLFDHDCSPMYGPRRTTWHPSASLDPAWDQNGTSPHSARVHEMGPFETPRCHEGKSEPSPRSTKEILSVLYSLAQRRPRGAHALKVPSPGMTSQSAPDEAAHPRKSPWWEAMEASSMSKPQQEGREQVGSGASGLSSWKAPQKSPRRVQFSRVVSVRSFRASVLTEKEV